MPDQRVSRMEATDNIQPIVHVLQLADILQLPDEILYFPGFEIDDAFLSVHRRLAFPSEARLPLYGQTAELN